MSRQHVLRSIIRRCAISLLAAVAPPVGFKLKVRETASATGKVLGELDKGAQVTILEGPTDANGIKWWKVDNGKVI